MSAITERTGVADLGARAARRPLRFRVSEVSLLPVMVLIIVAFSLLAPDTFPTVQTFRSIASDQAITALMALALLLPLATGVYDLSIGGVMGLSMVLLAWLQYDHSFPLALAVALSILAGLTIGAVNAIVIVRLQVNSFIATLGMQSILLAAVQWVSGGQNIAGGISSTLTNAGTSRYLGLPASFVYMLVFAVVLWYLLTQRQVGRYFYATGSNPDAARLAGVPTYRLQVWSLLVSSFIASCAGILFVAKVGAASLGAGPPYLLPAFAAVFLGATQFRARQVNVLGTLIAVYVLATGVRGLQLIGAKPWIADLFNGLALIVAVAIAGRTSRVASRRAAVEAAKLERSGPRIAP